MAKVIQVIEVETTRGVGNDERDPLRAAIEYFSTTGELLAVSDDIGSQIKATCVCDAYQCVNAALAKIAPDTALQAELQEILLEAKYALEGRKRR